MNYYTKDGFVRKKMQSQLSTNEAFQVTSAAVSVSNTGR